MRAFVRQFATNDEDTFDIAISFANSSQDALPADESALLSFGLTPADLQAMSSAAKSGGGKPGKPASSGRCQRCNRNNHTADNCFATTRYDPVTGQQLPLSPGIDSTTFFRPDFDGLRRTPTVTFRRDAPPPSRYS